jgi:hypothetical protein
VGAVHGTVTPPDPHLKGAWYPGDFQPSHLSSEKTGFKTCLSNGSTCAATNGVRLASGKVMKADVVGLCTLNQVDPCPITYNLSNP